MAQKCKRGWTHARHVIGLIHKSSRGRRNIKRTPTKPTETWISSLFSFYHQPPPLPQPRDYDNIPDLMASRWMEPKLELEHRRVMIFHLSTRNLPLPAELISTIFNNSFWQCLITFGKCTELLTEIFIRRTTDINLGHFHTHNTTFPSVGSAP